MKKKSILFAAAVCCAMCANAQIKVNNSGKVIVGNEWPNNDYKNVLTMSLLGKEGNCRPGSKLGFGDFGYTTTGGWRVFVGEFGNTDTDKLWLHGEEGFYITCTGNPATTTSTFNNTANYVVAYFNMTDNAFRFNVPVYTNLGVLVTSDRRFKKNIKGINNAMSSLKKLNGVSFDYIMTDGQLSDSQPIDIEKQSDEQLVAQTKDTADAAVADKAMLTEKELREKENMKKYEKLRAEAAKNHLGLIAQEVQLVFPELVKEDTAGYLYVDYIGLIPVIIEALKEQQSIIDAQSRKIKELEKGITSNNSVYKEGRKKMLAPSSSTEENEDLIETEDITTNAFLFQNTPNPFNTHTEIKSFVPDNTENAVLYVFSLNGNMLLSKPLTKTGNGSIIINGSELKPGVYIYSLAVNGVEVDSRRMILTNE